METVFTEAADSGHNGHEFFGLDIECPWFSGSLVHGAEGGFCLISHV
jgi:hypothetical protein